MDAWTGKEIEIILQKYYFDSEEFLRMIETAKLRASTIGRTSIFTWPSRTVSESKFKKWPPTSPESENLKKGNVLQ